MTHTKSVTALSLYNGGMDVQLGGTFTESLVVALVLTESLHTLSQGWFVLETKVTLYKFMWTQ